MENTNKFSKTIIIRYRFIHQNKYQKYKKKLKKKLEFLTLGSVFHDKDYGSIQMYIRNQSTNYKCYGYKNTVRNKMVSK